MTDLETRLADLGEQLDWPPTPALTSVRRRQFPTRWALAAAAVLVIAATLLAYTPTRTAIAGWLNLHTNLKHTTQLPTPSPLPSGTLGSNLGLGVPTTVAAAQETVGWQVQVPGSLGPPDAVYLLMPPQGPMQGEVTL